MYVLQIIFILLSAVNPCYAESSTLSGDVKIEFEPGIPAFSLMSEVAITKDWAYEQTEFSALPLFNLTGKGVRVGIIDSGVSPHQDIPSEKIVAQKSFATDNNDVIDGVSSGGHGTSVAALIVGSGKIGEGAKGIAPDAELVNVRIINSDGSIPTSAVADAIDYCVEMECDVINMSFGTMNEIADYTKVSTIMKWNDSIQNAISKGCIVIAAAGNYGVAGSERDFVVYPAGLPNVIGVGATTAEGTINAFSQKNESVFVAAPGKRVYTAVNTSETSYAYVSGTSFAAPIVSGIAALIKEAYPDATQKDVRDILTKTVTDFGADGYDYSFGHGVINGKNLAKNLRNSDFYAYFDKDGKAFAANIGDDREVLSYIATYSGGRNTDVSDASFSLDSMTRKELEAPENVSIKRFFWLADNLFPLCAHLDYN